MIKSCIAIWVDKIKGDYERYSKAVSDEMGQASSKLSESIWCKHLCICAHYGFSMCTYTSPNFLSYTYLLATFNYFFGQRSDYVFTKQHSSC